MKTVVIISANAEWRAVKQTLAPAEIHITPLGEWFEIPFNIQPVTFYHGGWGKISAAATAQYVIDRWSPELLVNLGTCGGFAGHIAPGTVILVEKTIVYDILEQMSDPDEAIAHYSTEIDLTWLKDHRPSSVVRGLLVSADRDIVAGDIPMLVEKYGAVAADWESGAIAWVAKRNRVRCLILRGVTDLVGAGGGEAYGNVGLFKERARVVMKELIEQLPAWVEKAEGK